ncbi:hypothetical protein XELAEV_18030962mg [Xenopus laevis]|uniref:Transmembrane protein n=1 Tax=Xenopus laevis TaxID=8355 RepID=A0A974CLP2_XENLA|nr:hypothetical protein XELAEV_18030962mg [Xenopus laevis]
MKERGSYESTFPNKKQNKPYTHIFKSSSAGINSTKSFSFVSQSHLLLSYTAFIVFIYSSTLSLPIDGGGGDL